MITINRPRIKKYGFKFPSHKIQKFIDARNWCKKEFGNSGDSRSWTTRMHTFRVIPKNYGYTAIYFDNAEDAVAFKLRWL